MGALQRVREALGRRLLGEKRSTLRNPPNWLYDALAGSTATASGERVSPSKALSLVGYFACIRNIAEDVAKLPLWLYERLDDDRRKRRPDHNLFKLLNRQPNPEMTAMSYRETLMGHVLSWGNSYSEIVRTKAGAVAELYLIAPDRVTPYRTDGNKELRYRITIDQGGYLDWPKEKILHIHGLGYDGILGYSVAHRAREALGLMMAEEKAGAASFANRSIPGGVLRYPEELTPEARKNLRESWERMHGGPKNAYRTALLEHGVEYQVIAIPAKDKQWIESRKFSITQAAALFRMPPHKIQQLDNATYSNIEHQGREYVGDALQGWFTRIEQALAMSLMSPAEAERFYFEHLAEALLRGDTKARFESYAIARQWGWLSANDIRKLENMDPIEGGDIYLIPMNMVPADKVLEKFEKELEAPAPVPPQFGPPEGDEGAPNEEAQRFLPDLMAGLSEWFVVERQRAQKALDRGVAEEWANEYYGKDATRQAFERHVIPPVQAYCRALGGDLPAEWKEKALETHAEWSRRDLRRRFGRNRIVGEAGWLLASAGKAIANGIQN